MSQDEDYQTDDADYEDPGEATDEEIEVYSHEDSYDEEEGEE